MDQKKNGDEVGVDCGGSCQLFCKEQTAPPYILWSRAFHVTSSNYNLLAYVENQNQNGAVYKADYEFRVYDVDGNFIGRRGGQTFIPPNQRFAIFEPRFDAGTAIPKNVTFSFTSELYWVKKDPFTQRLPIRVEKVVLSGDSSSPVLNARIINESIYDLPEFDVITILYDANANAIAVSKTHLDSLKSNQASPLYFTWPLPFSETPIVKDVLPQINPFLLKY